VVDVVPDDGCVFALVASGRGCLQAKYVRVYVAPFAVLYVRENVSVLPQRLHTSIGDGV